MEIKDAKYSENGEGTKVCVIALVDGVQHAIPLDANNRHYAEILKQVEEKTLTIKDAD